MSKQISLRQRRKRVSSCIEMSNSSSCESCMKRACIAAVSLGMPRTENSTHDFDSGCSSSPKGIRPVRRCMESIFMPCSEISAVTLAICRAVSRRPRIVIIQRSLPCIPTQFSYSSILTGEKRTFTLSSVALKSSSFMMLPETAESVFIRMPSERV